LRDAKQAVGRRHGQSLERLAVKADRAMHHLMHLHDELLGRGGVSEALNGRSVLCGDHCLGNGAMGCGDAELRGVGWQL